MNILEQKSTNQKSKFRKAAGKTFLQKSCTQSVGEIDLWSATNFYRNGIPYKRSTDITEKGT